MTFSTRMFLVLALSSHVSYLLGTGLRTLSLRYVRVIIPSLPSSKMRKACRPAEATEVLMRFISRSTLTRSCPFLSGLWRQTLTTSTPPMLDAPCVDVPEQLVPPLGVHAQGGADVVSGVRSGWWKQPDPECCGVLAGEGRCPFRSNRSHGLDSARQMEYPLSCEKPSKSSSLTPPTRRAVLLCRLSATMGHWNGQKNPRDLRLGWLPG